LNKGHAQMLEIGVGEGGLNGRDKKLSLLQNRNFQVNLLPGRLGP
jgi:hypothetical protein